MYVCTKKHTSLVSMQKLQFIKKRLLAKLVGCIQTNHFAFFAAIILKRSRSTVELLSTKDYLA